MEAEGVVFRYGEAVDLENLGNLRESYDAIVIATGTPTARDLKAPGRELKGIHLALELLSQQNRVLVGMEFSKEERITAKGKDVLVIGGGDTGSDCIGTAHRQGCKSVTQIEIMPKPPVGHNPNTPWPNWPVILKTTSSHEEGCTRRWNINTLEFIGEEGHVTGCVFNPSTGNLILKVADPSWWKQESQKSSRQTSFFSPWDSSSPNIHSIQRTYSSVAMPPAVQARGESHRFGQEDSRRRGCLPQKL